ncbi:MAG: inositol monophosphatase family protein [Pseudomonadota bacterium]
MIVDIDKVSEIIADVAEAEIASRFGNLSAADVATKSSPSDFVTEADKAAETALARALNDIWPGAAFVGEESVADDPSVLSNIETDGALWIVDPLDGTRNFVNVTPEFGSIVALVVDGDIRAGWIYAIPDRKMLSASFGDGACWDGQALAPLSSPSGPLRGYRAIGNMEEPWKSRLIPNLRAGFETEPAHCSAYSYIRMALGDYDFALYSRCWPWDHAAGALILREVDGRSEYLDTGAPYRPVPTQGRPLLIAGGADRWLTVRDTLFASDQ